MSDAVKMNLKGMDDFKKALKKAKNASLKVGILGSSAVRGAGTSADTLTNASIGASHEFGTSSLPRRSWLREPLQDHLFKKMESSGLFGKSVADGIVKKKSLKDFLEKTGVVCIAVIAEGFATGGYGKWKPSNMAYKKVAMTLVETGQLRDSVTYEVTE